MKSSGYKTLFQGLSVRETKNMKQTQKAVRVTQMSRRRQGAKKRHTDAQTKFVTQTGKLNV